jgi:hypothetical protein
MAPARRRLGFHAAACGVLQLTIAVASANAQQPAGDDAKNRDLAKQLSNPIASLVSVPFQFNWEENVGPFELTRFVLNVQPVIPFEITENVNLIFRLIAPFIGQPPLTDGGLAASGVSDITTSFFFSPSESGAIIWGAGPVLVLPSTNESILGTGKYSAGPTIVALRQTGSWTFGALWNQVWSFSGDSRRPDVNQMFLQPFLSYQATHTVTLTVQSEATANWEAATRDERWTVPINVLVSKLATFGPIPASYAIGVGGFPTHPPVGPSWKVRGAITLLLPREN